MGKKRDFQVYTGMWLVAILVLLALLWQNMGDARIINYSGLVRGATQKLVKEELYGAPDDELISYIDGIIYDLQTGQGDYGLSRSHNEHFQQQLAELKLVWEDIKKEIPLYRSGAVSSVRLYELSRQHFVLADNVVLCAEKYSDSKLTRSILFYLFSLILSITVFAVVNRHNQKELEKSISIDKLTGLPNRTGFEKAAADLLRQHPRSEYIIIEFDIDNFKMINDAYGYAMGDRLLCGLAKAVAGWQGYLCARIDADDFVLLAEWSDTLIYELRALLEQTVKGMEFLEAIGDVSFTFGAYRIEDNGELIKTIMDKANTAHKTAKVHEHKALIWYDKRLLEKLKLESRYREQLHHGIAAEEFQMYLQPKVDLNRMEVMGAEALVRWELPGSGLVYPDAYIPLFEENGSIAELDFYMLEKACSYIRRQLDRGGPAITISVNFSRVTLYQQQFMEKFLETVDRFELPHRCIEVEITESAFNEITDSVLQLLTSLKDAGFYISMDDFGAGYSNLNMLSRLPIQIIKLDREFIWEIDRNENMRGIIACVVELAHTMGIRVVCEGVEEEDHVTFLQDIGCDYVQGYYFSKPVPQEEFSDMCQTIKNNMP